MNYDEEDRLGAAEDLAPIAQGGSGQVVTITTPTRGPTNPATDTSTPGAPLIQTGSGIEETYSADSVARGLVAAGDIKFLLSPLDVNGAAIVAPVPDRSMLNKADGEWLIKKVNSLQPAGLPILFTLQLRRGG